MERISDEEKLPGEQRLRHIANNTEKKAVFRAFNYFLAKYAGVDRHGRKATGVKVPFLGNLIHADDDYCGSDIRRFKMLRNAIKASAILHSAHREVIEDGEDRWLIATEEDFDNIKDAFEVMVPRVTKPAGQAYLGTFRKIVRALFDNPGGQNKKWLRSTYHVSKKAVEEHLNDLVEVDLLELVQPKDPKDRQNYYALGPKFSEHLQAVQAQYPTLDVDSALEKAVQRAVEEVENVHRVNQQPRTSGSLKDTLGDSEQSACEAPNDPPQYLAQGGDKVEKTIDDLPRTSIHLKDEARQLERPTGQAIEYPPHHLAGGSGKGNTKAILGRK